MSQRLKRIVRKVNNNQLQKQREALPPRQQLIKEAHILREAFPHDRKVQAITDAFLSVDEVLFGDGCTVRHGGGEKTKPVPLPKELRPYAAQWAKTPPEWGDK
jgi:hypothetical protein